jgi:endonuclease/exonuclease/phosphatase family metal-dependent hydrolase
VYLSPHVNPQGKWPLAVLSLFYPALLIIHFSFILFWGALRRWQFLLSLGCVLAGWGHVRTIIGFSSPKAGIAGETEAIRVMTFNCYSFLGSNGGAKLIEPDQLAQLLRNYEPDILCLQEFANTDEQVKKFSNWVRDGRDFPYALVQTEPSLAIFSRYPLTDKAADTFPGSYNGYQRTDVAIGDHNISLFNLHLQTNAITGLADKVVDSGDLKTRETWMNIGGMLRRYQRAARKRVAQAKEVQALLKQASHPVVICGDFNDVPQSYVYRLLRQGYTDTFRKAGVGLGVTYSGKIPGLRIDYIFTPAELSVLETRVLRPGFSDHRPVLSTVAFQARQK